MKPQKQDADELFLFQSHFEQLLNPNHALVKLAKRIDWQHFDKSMGEHYCPDQGAPALPTRLMVGLHYLKHAFDESDESVVERWVENPYWQYFCGYTHLQYECPIHPTSMTKWRKRLGETKLNELLQHTIHLAVAGKHLPVKELPKVTVDTTVQEKNITHPTDSKLLYRAIVKLAKAAKCGGLTLRQTYLRVGKAAAWMAGRYAHAQQWKRMGKQLRKLKTYLGRMLRDIGRQVKTPDLQLQELLEKCQRLLEQKQEDSDKLYSLHEPEVCCICKGKAHKRYEFGQKVSLAVTNRGNWFVGALLCPDNPYDGHTLAKALANVESNTGVKLSDVYVDKGYRKHNYTGQAQVHISGSKSRDGGAAQKKRRRRRSAIEPKIGHAKSESRLGRCYLKGLIGDGINAVLAAAGANFRKLLKLLPCAWILCCIHRLRQGLTCVRTSGVISAAA